MAESLPDRYVICREIAAGGMATVHLGRLLGAGGFARTVAIKRLFPQYARDPEFVAMFLDEARLASYVRHPNVIPTLDVVAHATGLLLVMEYVDGESLARLAAGTPVPPAIASSVVAGALRGLHAAHEATGPGGAHLGIVHRDVSPQNILVGADGVARVLDFGIAKAVGHTHRTQQGELKGKLPYMAPEQVRSEPVDRRTDVYAAGVVLWEALVGRRLFRGDAGAAVMHQVLFANVRTPSAARAGVPSALDEVVLRALSREPGARFASAEEMANAVEASMPPAPNSEVAAWVRTRASEALARRATWLREVENEAEHAADARSGPAAPGGGEVSTAIAQQVPTPDDKRSPASLRRRVWLGAGVVGALLAVGFVGVTGARGRGASTASTAATATATATAVSTETAATSVGAKSAEPPPADDEEAHDDDARANEAPLTAAPSSVARGRRGAAREPSPARCTPPYVIDADGAKHFKRECL